MISCANYHSDSYYESIQVNLSQTDKLNNQEQNIFKNPIIGIIRLQRRLSNFIYPYAHNQFFTFNMTSLPPFFRKDHPLKHYWRIIQHLYFRHLQSQEFKMHNWIKNNFQFQGSAQIKAHFVNLASDHANIKLCQNEYFWDIILKTFEVGYLLGYHKIQQFDYQKIQLRQLDRLNLIAKHSIIWCQLTNDELQQLSPKKNGQKYLEQKLQKVKNLSNIFPKINKYLSTQSKKHSKNKTLIYLEKQSRNLAYYSKEVYQPEEQYDQLSSNIQQLQAQIQQIVQQREDLLYNVYKVMISSVYQDSVINLQKNQQSSLTKTQLRLQKCFCLQAQRKFIQDQIGRLEKKQAAQSIQKIHSVRLGQTLPNYLEISVSGDIGKKYFYQVQFQQALQLKRSFVIEQEMMELNKLRQNSIFCFYNTALKSRFTYVNHTFQGFRQIYMPDNKLSNKPTQQALIQMMKSQKQSKQKESEESKAFQQLSMCHHCKLLCPQSNLVQCQFKSFSPIDPSLSQKYYDQYRKCILQKEENIPYENKGESFYIRYEKNRKHHFCRCARRYCKYCVNNCYPGSFEDDLCFFCQEKCLCSRCQRHDHICKLKSIYVLIGGNIEQLQKQSYLNQFYKTIPKSNINFKLNLQSGKNNFTNINCKSISAYKKINTDQSLINQDQNQIQIKLRVSQRNKSVQKSHQLQQYSQLVQSNQNRNCQQKDGSASIPIVAQMAKTIKSLKVMCKITIQRQRTKFKKQLLNRRIFEFKTAYLKSKLTQQYD